MEIQRVVRKHYEQPYTKKLEHMGEMDKFLETYNFPKSNQEKSENLSRVVKTNEIEVISKKLPANKCPELDGFPSKFYQTSNELTPTLLKLFQKIQRREYLQTLL